MSNNLDPKAQAVFDVLTELITVALVKMPCPPHMTSMLYQIETEAMGFAYVARKMAKEALAE